MPLKYQGLDPWEIWVSESQERMVVGSDPGKRGRFQGPGPASTRWRPPLSAAYTDRGVLEVKHQGRTCAYMDFSLLEEEFPALGVRLRLAAAGKPPE